MAGSSGQRDGSFTVKDAAARLGVSERTIRRRIKDRVIDAQQVPTAQGYEWRVYLDTPAVQVDTPSTRHAGKLDGTPAPELMKALEMVDRLQRENQQLAGQLGFLQARVQEQERTIARLMAPQEPESAPAVQAEQVQPRRSWWQLLLGRD
jgi:excisionase family DNA binding protein